MSKKPMPDISPAGTDWDRLRAMTDEEIRRGIKEDPDAHPTTPEFWETARLVRPKQKAVTLLLDPDLASWIQANQDHERKAQAALRSLMEAEKAGAQS